MTTSIVRQLPEFYGMPFISNEVKNKNLKKALIP